MISLMIFVHKEVIFKKNHVLSTKRELLIILITWIKFAVAQLSLSKNKEKTEHIS